MDAREELERAAKQQRDKRAAAVAGDGPAREAWRREKFRRRYRKSMMNEALGGQLAERTLVAAILIGLLAPLVAVVVLGIPVLLGTPIVLACIAVAVVINIRLVALIHARALRRLGPRFDGAGYRELLAENWSDATAMLTVELARAWPENDRDTVVDAVRTWDPDVATVEWHGDALRLTSAKLKTTEMWTGRYSSGFDYTNRFIHDWVERVAAKVVPKLARLVPVERVQLDIAGTRMAWDDKP